MTTQTTFLVNREQFSTTRLDTAAAPDADGLKSGQVLMQVDRFSLTANNITYAATGSLLRYWEFFPAGEGMGIIPVWGFADVVASNCEGVEVGERFYGYYPMSTHLVVEPTQIGGGSFVDGAEHRRPLSVIYNQYIRCSADPLYQADAEALQMLLRPLFTTSFLLDDFFDDNDFFGANTIVLTSASSKTAVGMAYCLQQNRAQRDSDYTIVGLTSPKNREFVEKLGCYDKVLSYDQIGDLDSGVSSAIVDFAGSGTLLTQLYTHLGEQLQYSCQVGASHWDQLGNGSKELAGPSPVMFFAPTQAEKRLNEWGGEQFQQRLAGQWHQFTAFADGWLAVDERCGPEAIDPVYQDLLAGRFDPTAGYIISFG